ncbi:MAG: hypothetical protein V3V40_06375 [Nitrosomonadaceae bacterium]
MKIKARIKKKIRHNIGEWLYNEHASVKVTATQGIFNFRCFENAVQWAKDHEDHSVIMGIYIDPRGDAVLHFWNKNQDGEHLETTRGFYAETLKYYPMRTIHADDYLAIGHVFDDALEHYTNKFVNRWAKFWLNGDRVF